MRFAVLLSVAAERDLEDIYRYIVENDSVANADRVLAGLETACQSWRASPIAAMFPRSCRCWELRNTEKSISSRTE